MEQKNAFFATEKVSRLLWRLAPPVMLAQLIQALYNIVDSYFIGQYDPDGLAALSVIFPIQLLISAFAIGTGVGVNTLMSKFDGLSNPHAAGQTAGAGQLLALLSWVVFAVIACAGMELYTQISLSTPQAQAYACTYGRIVCGLSLGIFLESGWTKILQARGDMKTPMLAQAAGALVNIVLDPLLIFGIGFFPAWGVAGAAIATVAGQAVAACIVGRKACRRLPSLAAARPYIGPIYRAGAPNILMNALCTVYIVALNLILAGFSDDAVTVLGLYYKLQTFCLIPVLGLTTCIVPLISYNYAAGLLARCKSILWQSIGISVLCMGIGALVFFCIPAQLLGIFAEGQTRLITLGIPALRIIGSSFVPTAFSMVIAVYFLALGRGIQSIFLTVLRQIILLAPLAWCFAHLGLIYVWLAFPVTELVTAAAAWILYRKYPLCTAAPSS